MAEKRSLGQRKRFQRERETAKELPSLKSQVHRVQSELLALKEWLRPLVTAKFSGEEGKEVNSEEK